MLTEKRLRSQLPMDTTAREEKCRPAEDILKTENLDHQDRFEPISGPYEFDEEIAPSVNKFMKSPRGYSVGVTREPTATGKGRRKELQCTHCFNTTKKRYKAFVYEQADDGMYYLCFDKLEALEKHRVTCPVANQTDMTPGATPNNTRGTKRKISQEDDAVCYVASRPLDTSNVTDVNTSDVALNDLTSDSCWESFLGNVAGNSIANEVEDPSDILDGVLTGIDNLRNLVIALSCVFPKFSEFSERCQHAADHLDLVKYKLIGPIIGTEEPINVPNHPGEEQASEKRADDAGEAGLIEPPVGVPCAPDDHQWCDSAFVDQFIANCPDQCPSEP